MSLCNAIEQAHGNGYEIWKLFLMKNNLLGKSWGIEYCFRVQTYPSQVRILSQQAFMITIHSHFLGSRVTDTSILTF